MHQYDTRLIPRYADGKPIACMHGLGAYKGLRQTNAKEAFAYWHNRNVYAFEFDIARTQDGEYVAAAHTVDRKSLFRMEITEVPPQYTRDWFVSKRLFPLTTGGLTPFSLQDIIDLLCRERECLFIFDLFGLFDAAQVREAISKLECCKGISAVKSRLLLESYNKDMLEEIRAHAGFQAIHCVRYEGNIGEAAMDAGALKELGIRYISYPWKYTKTNRGELKQYVDAGLIVFSRTKYNTRNREMIRNGVTYNIIDYKFTPCIIPIQMIVYGTQCMKRLLVKAILKGKRDRVGLGKHEA